MDFAKSTFLLNKCQNLNVKYNKKSFSFISDFPKPVDDNSCIFPLINFCCFYNHFINFAKNYLTDFPDFRL